MRTRAIAAAVAALATLFVLSGDPSRGASMQTAPATPVAQAAPAQSQQPAQQQPQIPIFRGGVKLVRVDATVTDREDRPVDNLQASEFEVTEDGVPQTVEQVQFIKLDGRRPSGDETTLDIRSQEQALVEAAREDVRLFAIFLDDYHIDKRPEITLPMRENLSRFIERLWPSDLVAVMEPLTPLSALRLTRSKEDLLRAVRSFEGRQGELYPIKSVFEEAQWASGDVRALRAEVTLSALAALTVRLGGIREGRKTILFVSQGPPTFLGMARNLQDRMSEITRAANTGNVTIYTLDPRGLGMDYRLGARDTLYQLAAETGGRAIVNTNNFDGVLGRMLRETSAYYVIGYTPTRTEDDGKFHKIGVKVRRPGVRVLARQGYWAPSPRETEAAAAATAASALEPEVKRALDAEAERAPARRPAVLWLGVSPGPDGLTLLNAAWEPAAGQQGQTPATLDIEIQTTGGKAGATPVRSLAPTVPGQPAPVAAPFLLDPGPAKVKFTARGADGSVIDDWTSTLNIQNFAGYDLTISTPRAFRSRSVAEWRVIRVAEGIQPSANWDFRRNERVLVTAEIGTRDERPITVEAHVLTREGRELTSLPLTNVDPRKPRLELPVGSFGQGSYLLRLRARGGSASAETLIAFRVTP